MILSKPDLIKRFPEIIPFEGQRDEKMVNPASIDIRIGASLIYEIPGLGMKGERSLLLQPFRLKPQAFVLLSTYEYISVPMDLAIELKLKSSLARAGADHSLAFWVDPGWKGVLTMEVSNNLQYGSIELSYGQPFAQLIVHKLTTPVEDGEAYNGRYQFATSVEGVKQNASL